MEMTSEGITRDQLSSPLIEQLYVYWDEKRGARRYPAKSDIILSEIPDIEPYLIFCDLSYPPLDIVYTYVGKKMALFYGRELLGKRPSDVYVGNRLRQEEVYHRLALTSDQPLLRREGEMWPTAPLLYEWAFFQLTDGTDHIICNLSIEDVSALDLENVPEYPFDDEGDEYKVIDHTGE